MASHEWVYKGQCHRYGQITNKELRNTQGIKICPKYGEVRIAFWNQDSNPIEPYIFCDENKFEINKWIPWL
mgnify:CR=1 FL=1